MSDEEGPQENKKPRIGMALVSFANPELSASLMDVMQELLSASDRSCAIVGGSVVELSLESTLKRCFRHHPHLVDLVFKERSPLSNFQTKISLGEKLGLYSEEGAKELNRIRKIRNCFAHNLEITRFDVPPVVDFCRGLQLGERYSIDNDEVEAARANRPAKGTPERDWSFWIATLDREENLKLPRGRFLLTMQALNWILSAIDHPIDGGHF